MRRRTFLYGLAVGALGARGTSAWAQPPAPKPPSSLAEGTPSHTALGTANMRAAHQLIDNPKIFDDPLALKIIGPHAEAAVRMTAARGLVGSPLRPFVVVRSRFTEDELATAVQRGVRQYVVLGAGLDTFAYRNPYPARLRVFEVDHPSTQVWKRSHLKGAGIAIPESLTFAAIDFETQTLAGGLQQAGFNADEPTFFSMLGVVIYLSREAAMSTLKFVAERPAGSEIVFDYGIEPSAMNEDDRTLYERTARDLARRGEPWITHFTPAPLAADLRGLGFTRVEDLGPDEIHERYFKGRTDGLRVNTMARLVKASK